MDLSSAMINASRSVRIRQKKRQIQSPDLQKNSTLEPLQKLLKASFYQNACCIIADWIRGVAQSGSAPHWGCGGRRFKSCRPDQIFIIVTRLCRRKYVLETPWLPKQLDGNALSLLDRVAAFFRVG
jgi:hypothetical protein